jgi:hypothetical protein
MKKFFAVMVLGALVAVNAFADENAAIGFWFDAPKGISSTNVDGIGLGVPVIANKNLRGASLALCGNDSATVSGVQAVLFGYNSAKSMYGLQWGIVNMIEKQHDDFALQLGFFNHSKEQGVQLGFINCGENNATFQLGLVNINKNGFFPIMIFVNFSKDLFD